MALCHSYYQNINQQGEPLGNPKRCRLHIEGHLTDASGLLHTAGASGHRTFWTTDAQMVHPWTSRQAATELPANVTDLPKSDIPAGQMSVKYADGDIVADTAARIACQNSELMARLADKPAEDEREALANVLLDGRDADEGLSALRDRILAAGYSKGARPIPDEMVEVAAREYHERGNGEGSYARMSGHVRTSLLFRMKCALRAAEEARR